jgi:hypothetical protein
VEWKNGETYIVSEAIIEPSGADSLVERVQSAINDIEFPHGSDESRAAIRVMAGELRAQCFVHAADWLDAQCEQ